MKKIYETDSYVRQLRAEVTACTRTEDGWRLTLSETIFFPEEGGQYADTGVLQTEDGQTIHVLDGQLQGDTVVYAVDGEVPVGTVVEEVLDWEKRYMRMQQHTAEHILSGQIYRTYGYRNVGFHLSDDEPVTLDVNGPLTSEQVYELERCVGQIIRQNLPVVVSFPSREELATLDYRSKIEIAGQVRLVAVGEDPQVDLCACCAPHVQTTGEIGLLCVTQVQNYKGGTRISMLAGDRAAAYIREKLQTLQTIARELTTAPEEILSVIRKNQEELVTAKQKMSLLAETLLMQQAETAGKEHVWLFAGEEVTATAVKHVMEKCLPSVRGVMGVFLGDDTNGYRYQLSSAQQEVLPVHRQLVEVFGAKGGGREPLVQGRVNAARSALEAMLQQLPSCEK